MPIYEVTIIEHYTLARTYEVRAEDEDTAVQQAEGLFEYETNSIDVNDLSCYGDRDYEIELVSDSEEPESAEEQNDVQTQP